MELEVARLNHQPENEDCKANEDNKCNQNLPQDSEETATAASAAVRAVAWLLRRGNGGTVISTVQVGLLIGHVCRWVNEWRELLVVNWKGGLDGEQRDMGEGEWCVYIERKGIEDSIGATRFWIRILLDCIDRCKNQKGTFGQKKCTQLMCEHISSIL